MAYTFLPPRTVNYAPPGMPYLSGFGALGDYASDYAAWQSAHAAWKIKQQNFPAALAAYNASVKTIKADYEKRLAAYNVSYSNWQAEVGAYNANLSSWAQAYQKAYIANKIASDAVNTKYGLKLPSSYYQAGACITAAQQASYRRNCTTVRGLGTLGLSLSGSEMDCHMAKLPICNLPAKPTPPRAQPTKPAPPSYPLAPVLPPEPQPPQKPPVLTTPPVVTVIPPSSGGGGGGGNPVVTTTPNTPIVEEPQDDPQRGMIMNGLILVAVGVGGYLVYRTLKKPKAQAA